MKTLRIIVLLAASALYLSTSPALTDDAANPPAEAPATPAAAAPASETPTAPNATTPAAPQTTEERKPAQCPKVIVPQRDPNACPGTVSLGGEVVMRIHVPLNGKTCQQRADEVQCRIIDSLSIGLVYPRDIYVKKVGSNYGVYCKKILLVVADKQDARFNKTTSEKLAKAWCANFRRTIPECTPLKPGVHGPAIR